MISSNIYGATSMIIDVNHLGVLFVKPPYYSPVFVDGLNG